MMLKVTSLAYATPAKRVLFTSLSFEVVAGEILQIQGENGSGKTTLLRLLAGELPLGSLDRVEWHIDPTERIYIPQSQNRFLHLPLSLQETIETLAGTSVSQTSIVSLGLLQSSQLKLAWDTASGESANVPCFPQR